MEFFLPEINNKEIAEKYYQKLITLHDDRFGKILKDKRIYSIHSTHDKKREKYVIGEYNKDSNKNVFAIFETDACFLVCCPTRGAMTGLPIIVGKREAKTVVYFD